MRRYLVTLIVFFFTATAAPSGAGAAGEHWQVYVDKSFQVTLRYPSEWKKSPLYDSPRFEGREGFFMLDAIDNIGDSTPQQACEGSAQHHLRPFGSHPVIRSMTVQGRKACLVWPSEDQGAPWEAEIVAEYPRPIEIDGNRYDLFVLYADKGHILRIIRTVKFLSPTRGSR